MILCVTLNPCVDRTIFVDKLELDKIITGRESKCIPGGKGNNVARVLKTLGLPVDSFVLLGGHAGRLVEDMIRDQDGITPFVFWTKRPTREVVTIVEQGTYRQLAVKEPSPEITASEREGFLNLLRLLIPQYEWVVFSGSAPCPSLNDVYFRLIPEVRKAGRNAVLDSSGEALIQGLRAGPYLAKANLDEVACAVGRPVKAENEVWEAICHMRKMAVTGSDEGTAVQASSPLHVLAVTAGTQGAYIACGQERWRTIPPSVTTVNPVGSGDSFLGGLVAGLACGETFERSFGLATAAGAANAATWDAATFTRADIARLLPGVRVTKVTGH